MTVFNVIVFHSFFSNLKNSFSGKKKFWKKNKKNFLIFFLKISKKNFGGAHTHVTFFVENFHIFWG